MILTLKRLIEYLEIVDMSYFTFISISYMTKGYSKC